MGLLLRESMKEEMLIMLIVQFYSSTKRLCPMDVRGAMFLRSGSRMLDRPCCGSLWSSGEVGF